MRRFTSSLLAALVLAPVAVTAQVTPSTSWPAPDSILAKCDPWLKLELHSLYARRAPSASAASTENDHTVSLFVSGTSGELAGAIAGAGGRLGTTVGGLATAKLPLSRVLELARSGEVRRLELGRPVELHNDSALVAIQADRVHRGEAPLTAPGTGKGVLVGLIDTGIDFRHAEFRDRNDTSKTRVQAIWSLTDNDGPVPEGFDYGSEWTRADIEFGMTRSDIVRQKDLYAHGTHVAASAAGRGGVAPDASIAMVQFHNSFDALTTDVLDGAAYLYRLADRLGMPCVVNASLGTTEHPGDGSDPLARALDALLEEHPGRLFCASSGNGGGNKTHWGGFAAESDSLWTYIRYGTYSFRVPESEKDSFRFAIYMDTSRAANGRVPIGAAWRSAGEMALGLGVHDTLFGTAPHSSVVATLEGAATSIGNGFVTVVISFLPSEGTTARLMVKGRGMFHAWSSAFPPSTSLLTDGRYRPADNIYSVSTPAIAHDVIAVGACVNRVRYVDIDGGVHSLGTKVAAGDLSAFSSRGPAVDERVKPDIVAPGEQVISARSADAIDPTRGNIVGDGHYMVISGTSMSCPMVTGACALYLERHPKATVEQVRTALRQSAIHDAQTSRVGTQTDLPVPNGGWGEGKLNAFGMLTAPGAGVLVPSMAGNEALELFPNPADGEIVLRAGVDGEYRLAIYDAVGRLVEESTRSGNASLNVAGWPAGVYRCRVMAGDVVRVGAFVKSH